MSDVLGTIIEAKRLEVERLRAGTGLAGLEAAAGQASPPRGFAAALKKASTSGYGLIAELKKASPSKGLIRPDFDPVALAKAYAKGGAACLSVLTDVEWFQGAHEYLAMARDAAPLPVLRKDFIIDPIQVAESRALGADCVLLIMAALGDAQARELETSATELGMDVLIEVHDRAELDRALALSSPLVGINNRNLKTMEISLEVAETLLPALPGERIAIAESGLFSTGDLDRMAAAGARCFLVGESLMRADDVAKATATLLGGGVPAI